MNDVETKRGIEDALKAFTVKPIAEAAIALFEALGYKSQKRLALKPNSAANFSATFAQNRPFNEKHAILDDWQSADFLFQLTDDEVRAAAVGDQGLLFEAKGKWNGTVMESYLFFAVTLNDEPLASAFVTEVFPATQDVTPDHAVEGVQ